MFSRIWIGYGALREFGFESSHSVGMQEIQTRKIPVSEHFSRLGATNFGSICLSTWKTHMNSCKELANI